MTIRQLVPAAILCMACAASAQTKTGFNAKFFFNQNQIDATTRQSGTTTDTIYQMLPKMHTLSYSDVVGWKGVLQDENYNTAEKVGFGIVKFAANGKDPDVTTAGSVVNATATLNFPKPTTGNRSAAMWTLTLPTKAKIPAEHGLKLVLPKPAATSDGVYVHTQYGTSIKLPKSVPAVQHTFFLNNSVASNYFQAGTTLFMSVAYEQPIVQAFNQSTAYGTKDDLMGPESLYPDSTRKDLVGFRMEGSLFPNQVAVLMIAGGLMAKPISTNIGTFLTMPPGGAIQLPFELDKDGVAKSPAIAAPAGVKVWLQAAFIDLTSKNVRLSDAFGVDVK